MSHNAYWKDRGMLRRIADLLRSLERGG